MAHPVQYVFTVADKEIQANGADVLTIFIPILYSLTSLSVLLAENPLGVWTNAVSSPSAFGHIPVTAWFLLQLRQYLRSCFVHCLWICATYYCAGPITRDSRKSQKHGSRVFRVFRQLPCFPCFFAIAVFCRVFAILLTF